MNLGKLLLTLGMMICIAAILFPFLTGGIVSGLFYISGNQLEIDKSQLTELYGGLSARDYINIANGYAHANRGAEDVCRHIANATLVTYQYMIERDDRDDLKDSVRLVSEKGQRVIGHVWIEIYEDGSWIQYETTQYTPLLDSDNIKEYSENTKDVKSILNSDFSSETAEYRSIAGTRMLLPTTDGYTEFYNTTLKTIAQKL